MAFTTESIEAAPQGKMLEEPSQFDLPSKEFIGYDPKGHTSVTGSPLVNKETNTRQPDISVDDTQVAAEPPPAAESVQLSPKVSALARKEQAQRQREQALIKREQDLADKIAKADKFDQYMAKIAAKDYSVTEELGLKYDDFQQHELDKIASQNPEEQRFRKVEEELNKFKKAEEEREIRDYNANQALWKAEIVKVITTDEAFSTIKELNAQDIVMQHINDSLEEDDVELTVEQACKDIEDALVERAEKFANVSKVKNKSQESKVLGPPKTAATKTITQNMTTTSVTPKSKPFHLLSESEQIAEAIRRVQAQKLQR